MIKRYALKKITIYSVCLLLLLLFYFFPSHDNIIKEEKSNNKDDYIYLLDQDNYVSKVSVYFEEKTILEEIKERLNILIEGIDSFKGVIPNNTIINSIKIDKNKVYIDFNKEFLNTSIDNEEKMIESIVYSLTEINGIDLVYLSVNNKPLKELPISKKEIDYPLTRSIGINKEYYINSFNEINKTTVYFNKNNGKVNYYVPVTKINNSKDDKIKVILNELKSVINSQNNLDGYISDNLEIIDYKKDNNIMNIIFNDYIYDNDKVLKEVSEVLSLSILDNYDVDKIIFNTQNKNNIYVKFRY